MPNLTGQSIGRYHIIEQLGEGGMATVYKAYDTRLERNVALKILRTDQFIPAQLQMVLQRFEREAKSLAKLKHPNIVNILDFGEHEGMPYLIMEYLPGGTLKQKLGQKIQWQDAIQTLIPVARGLSYAHQHGVIHRDVKPANVLLDQNDDPILTDFGIAKLLEGTEGHTLTGSGVGIGTPEYMAPEQGIGASTIDARADIYSLGIVLYEMVTGRKPYIADTPMAVVLKQMTDPLPRPTDFVPDLPEGVEHILFKALAKDPNDRYADMNTLLAAMESVLTETKKVDGPIAEVVPPKKGVKGKTALRAKPSPKIVMTAVGGLAIILVIVFGAPWVTKQFSVKSEAEATSTKELTSTSTITLVPLTSTLELPPFPTLTRMPRPTSTNTPVPAWVTNFAEPILEDVQARDPDYQDSFDRLSNFWAPASWCPNSIKINSGVMEITTPCHIHWTKNYDNFVVAFDYRFPSSQGDQLRFYVRQIGIDDFPGCKFGFEASGEIYWECAWSSNFPSNIRTTKLGNHVLIIVSGSQFALYLNEEPVAIIQGEGIKLKYGASMLEGQNVSVDNFKLWQIP